MSNTEPLNILKSTDENINSLAEHYLGALDIGSNSFHFVFARVVEESLQILHAEKYQVKLASGLDENNLLDQQAIQRALQALKDLAPLTEKLDTENFRVVATFTLRQAQNTHELLKAAAEVFPFDIEVISGHEEARLIYQGVAHYTAPDQQRLIIDIGGGSTECVLGENFQTKYLTSLNIGCVSFYREHFADGKITKKRFEWAILQAKLEMESHVKRFNKVGWQQVLGTSGTMKALFNIVNHEQSLPKGVKLKSLHKLKDKLIEFGHVDKISLPGLKESRRPILAPGLAIYLGIAEMLKIESFVYCDYALREGVLYELLDKLAYKDIRQRTVDSLSKRFNIDEEHAQVVSKQAISIFEQVRRDWELTNKSHLSLLRWAALLHEIGFDINPSGYHKHGNYILTNADLPGFNLEQQNALAYLVGNQRKKLQSADSAHWYVLKTSEIEKCVAILRLSVLLNQQRQLTTAPVFTVHADKNSITLSFEQLGLDDRSTIRDDLETEVLQLKNIGIELNIATY
ncbi:exopolyphosphatase [Thalassotalea atypica]|uniref:Ppx/GppA phosphatase family protein n=1 Tax=Thalassotalea atypica TaxID=2054316 RepID=UPI002572D3C2|nr:exopolyphosphatase [Thalassotalea atypica]